MTPHHPTEQVYKEFPKQDYFHREDEFKVYREHYAGKKKPDPLTRFSFKTLKIIRMLFKIKWFRIGFIIAMALAAMFFYIGANMLAFILVIIGVLCFIPMRLMPLVGMEFGFSAMIIMSSLQGWQTGLIVGKVINLLGHVLTLQLSMDLVYEFFIYIPIAIVAGLAPPEYIVPMGVALVVAYNLGYMLFYYAIGLLSPIYMSYAITNALFNIFVLVKLTPFFL